jgi:hypothetical protein
MKNIIPFISILILGYLAQLVFPWWIIWLVCAAVCFYFKFSVSKSLGIGFLASFILWFSVAFILDHGNEAILSNKIGELFGGISGFNLVVISSLIGGITGSLGGITGSLGRKIIHAS